MAYFEKFPKILYDIDNTKNYKLVTDILRRVKVREAIRDNAVLFDKYDVDSGDSPETVAYKIYGSVRYYYVILLLNDIKDRYYDWPLSYQAFESYVKDKYANPSGIHHYEITQSSGTSTSNGPDDYDYLIEVNSTQPGAVAVTNYEYEQRLQDKKRQIKLLKPGFLKAFETEFEKLVRV
jgi:hypothetical protein